MPDDPPSLRVYRRLLKLYPAGFRDNYAGPLEREFRDELRESTGPAALAILWIRLLADLARSLPPQLAREAAQDASHTLRLWSRRPWHTAFAILALAIGIGANTGLFSVVNALLFRELPFQDPARLATFTYFAPPHDSVAQFHDWRRQNTWLADTALFEQFNVNLGGAGEWRRAHVAQVSYNFFSLLGVRPILGRAFTPGDDVNGQGWGTPGSNAVVVIGYGLWQSLFGADPKALGSTIRIDGVPLTVVGVAPPGFDYPAKAVLWKPAAFSRGNNGWETVARLKPGITWTQARQAFAVEADRLWPDRTPLQKVQYPSRMTELRNGLAGPARNASLVLLACVVLILLIACTNVANLLLARTADRAAEFSIRSALGASRARLGQQLLTECILLSLAAALAGIFVALWTVAIASRLQPAPLSSQAYSLLDTRVIAFGIGVSVLSGLLFGLLPAFCAGRFHNLAFRGATADRGSRVARESLVAAQVVLTIVLLASSLSLGRAFAHLMRVDRGFVPKGLVTVNVSLGGTTHSEHGLAYFQEALARVRRLPGVRAASATEFLPLYATGFIGGKIPVGGRPAHVTLIRVLPDYFRTMGGQILHGREFTEAETRTGAPVAIVSERVAAQFGSPADALGRQVGLKPPLRIIGVVKGMDYMAEGKITGENPSQLFVPSRSPGGFFSTFVVRVEGRSEHHLARIRDAIQSVDSQVPLFGVKTMEERLDEVLARPHFYRTAVLCFAAFAILLAVIGIYGIVSYTVARRTREMGVRMALGTTPARLRVQLLRQGLLTIAAAAVPGVAGTLLAGRFVATLIDGAQPVNAAACLATVLFIACVAATAIWTATRPVARLDIAEILRAE